MSDSGDIRRELIGAFVAGLGAREALARVSAIEEAALALKAFIDRQAAIEDPAATHAARNALLYLLEYAHVLSSEALRRLKTKSRLTVLDGGRPEG